MKKIKLNINKLLKERGLSQRKLAQMSNVRAAAINQMSQNKREKVSLHHLERIANVLNIDDINELITLEDEAKDG